MGAHPFQIRTAINGSAYNDGISNNGVSNGTLTWDVQMDAPNVLYYQCTSHAGMVGKIYIGNSGDSVNVGTGVTINAGGINVTGVVTATSFVGNGAGLTGLTANQVGAIGDVVSDTTPQLGGNLDLNSKTINGTGTINFTGNVTATAFAGSGANLTSLPVPTEVIVTDESSDTSCNVLFTTAATGNLAPKSGTNLTFNSSSGTLTATAFSGDGSALTNLPAGSTPDKIEEGNTSAEVVDTGSDGHFKVTTEGTERLRVVSSGRVGINSIAPTSTLDVNGTVNVTGVSTFQGNVNLGQSDKLLFNGTSGLEIYENGTIGVIQANNNSGRLTIEVNNGGGGNSAEIIQLRGTGNLISANFKPDSGVQLYGRTGSNSAEVKLETNSTGIDVTGHIEADTINVSGISTFGSTTVSSLIASNTTLLGGFTASGNSSIVGDLTLQDTDAGSAAGPELKLYRNSSTPADADYLGQIKFAGESDTGVERNYAKITGKISDASNTSEDGILEFAHIKAGSQTITGRWTSTELQLLNGTHFSLGDSQEIRVGASDDLLIYHDGSNSYIKDSGTGNLLIQAESLVAIQDTSGNNSAIFNDGGTVELYHNNSLKFTTQSYGIDVTGEVQCDSLDVDGAADISDDVTFQSATSGLGVFYDKSADTLKLLENGSDNTKLTIGDNSTYSSYMQMYHDGGNSGIGYINYAGSNKMILSGNNITFMNTSRSETMLTAVQDGAVELYHNNSKKFETTSGGATVTGTLTATTFSGSGASLTGVDATTLDSIDSGSFLRSDAADSKTSGNLTFNDTIQANFGTGNDLRIYHNGADSYIENYTGHLYLFTASDDKDIILQSDNGSGGLANYVTLDGSTGEVILGHYGTQKLATTGYGATVTGGLQVSGIVTATSFAGDGSALTGISAGSPEFYTGITSSRQIAPLSFESAVFTFPSTSGRQYVIESINVANVDESVGVGTTVNIIASIEDATAAEQTYIAYNVPIVTGGLIELLKNPIVAGPSDVIRMWTTSDTYVGVNNAADVYINYTEFESTDYISKFASSTTITSTDAVTLYTSTGNPTMIEKIGFANRTDTGDFPVSIKITNGVTTSYLAKNLIIPRYSTVDILDRHKRIETGAKIEVEVGSTNTIDVIISGKKITT